jgi:FMN phosphatase YigB (HAD superfamily)
LKLIVTDIDNTVFDWVTYYTTAFSALLDHISKKIEVEWGQLAAEAKVVFAHHQSIEYPFLAQELPAVTKHYRDDIDAMLSELVAPARDVFLDQGRPLLRPYDGVIETFEALRSRFPEIPIVALTDAPRYVAMWKLNKLGLLPFFDAVYGLTDPRIPVCELTRRAKVDPEILLKHLQQSRFGFQGKIRILPEDYEKPGTRGLKTVLMDYDLDEPKASRAEVLWIGDNLRKDVGLGERLGVKTVWAKYGTLIKDETMKKLHQFSPEQNIHKNVNLSADHADTPRPQVILDQFSQVLNLF